MDSMAFQNDVAEIRHLLEERLRVRGRDLDAQLRKARRQLPRAIEREARFLAQASILVQNPKLARMIDPTKAERAHDLVVSHLKSIDPSRRRTDRLLGFAGGLAFNILVIGAALVAVLVWRGFI